MTADVAQNAAVAQVFVKPRGSARFIADPVWPESEDLNNFPDRAALHEITRMHRALHVESLAKINHVFAARVGHDLPRLRQLLEGGERGFVRKIILARRHHPAADAAANIRNGGRRD